MNVVVNGSVMAEVKLRDAALGYLGDDQADIGSSFSSGVMLAKVVRVG